MTMPAGNTLNAIILSNLQTQTQLFHPMYPERDSVILPDVS